MKNLSPADLLFLKATQMAAHYDRVVSRRDWRDLQPTAATRHLQRTLLAVDGHDYAMLVSVTPGDGRIRRRFSCSRLR